MYIASDHTHCLFVFSSIGYPVVTVSFLVKHQVMHYIRQRQQRLVSDENSSCYEILQKALPIAIDQLLEEEESGRGEPRPSHVVSN